MRAAGYRGPDLFAAAAVAGIARASSGLTRRINILADKALLAADSAGSHQVDVGEVRIAGHDARFAPIQQKAAGTPRHALTWALAAALAASCAALAYALWPRPAAMPAPAVTSPAPAAAAAQPVVAGPQATTPETPTAAPAPALIAQHMALYAEWLKNAGSDRFFIQLTARGASHADDIERFLARAGQTLEPAQLRVYRVGDAEHGQIGVIYGDYPTRAAAWAATRAFPEALRRLRPYPRPVSALQQ
jgi:septal ring-binding cell division protein DamX